MGQAKAAVFDLGNVLLQWHPEAYYYERIGRDRVDKFFDAVPIDEMNERSDLGENLSDLTREYAAAYPEWSNEIAIWNDEWIKICAPSIQGSVRILERLKSAGVKVFSLTNFGMETLNRAKEVYPFLNLFDQEFVSGAVQVMKPDAGIYEALEAGTGLAGAELVFADDRLDNIQAAQARGWQTCHFREPQDFEAKLIEAGLLEAGS